MPDELYKKSSYGFDNSINVMEGIPEDYGKSFLGIEYRAPSSDFGFPTDPFTANQLQKVSEKISTGAKTIEISGLNLTGGGPMKLMDAIPKQAFKEINRLKKLAGVDLTFHGPLIEPTGVVHQGWDESDRINAERQMKSAVQRAHEVDPQGNLVVTFHSSVGLPEPESRYIDDKGEEVLNQFFVVNEDTGQFQNIAPEANYLKKEQKIEPKKIIEKRNEDTWFNELQSVSFHVNQGKDVIEKALSHIEDRKIIPLPDEEKKALLERYKRFLKGEKEPKEIEELEPAIQPKLDELTHGDLYLRQAYGAFQNLFNRAYKTAETNKKEENMKRLNSFRDEISPIVNELENDPSKVQLLGKELIKGINILRSIEAPQVIKPLKEWAVDKASTTFGNVAFDSFKNFKENSPIISIENPPAGSGLSTAEDLRKVIEESREKFVKKAMEELKLSKSEAEKQAEKLIGATWDVGHINLLRGKGYGEKHLIEQTKEIASFVKHVHLSDNFGLEHTELPMGMGNVPTKKMMELIEQYNKKVKKIAETGDWFSKQGGLGMTKTPVAETLSAFGSQVYQTGAPYWNQISGLSASYFSGQGVINPQIHHSIYGAGFSGLPVELGGQMAGRSRVSGAPIE